MLSNRQDVCTAAHPLHVGAHQATARHRDQDEPTGVGEAEVDIRTMGAGQMGLAVVGAAAPTATTREAETLRCQAGEPTEHESHAPVANDEALAGRSDPKAMGPLALAVVEETPEDGEGLRWHRDRHQPDVHLTLGQDRITGSGRPGLVQATTRALCASRFVSTSRFGKSASSQLGIHQVREPKRRMTAGSNARRTIVASSRTATASPTPN